MELKQKYRLIQWKYSRNSVEINRASLPAAGRLGEIMASRNVQLISHCEVYSNLVLSRKGAKRIME